jgi:hypothetical protein
MALVQLVERDHEGIRQAALEMLEESLDAEGRERIEKVAQQSDDPERILAASRKRTLPAGYYMWLEYIGELEKQLSAGVAISESDLPAADVAGLLALKSAREEFGRNHPPCRGCGKLLANFWDKACNECQREAAKNGKGF